VILRSKESIVGENAERLGARAAELWWSRLLQRHREAVGLDSTRWTGCPRPLPR
jgi:hypothetical protein